MRLIDADALHEALMTKQKWVVRRGDNHNEGYTYDQVHFAIDEAPTIEAVSIDDYRSMENTCYKLQKALYEMTDRKTENCSEIPNNCETCRNKGFEGCEQPCLGCGCCDFYEPKTEPQYDAEEVTKDINRRVEMVKKEWSARHIEDEPLDKDINVRSKDEPKLSEKLTSKCHYEPKTEPQTGRKE